MIMDLLDIWIPATGAGLVDLNEGLLGVLGFAFSGPHHRLISNVSRQSHHVNHGP